MGYSVKWIEDNLGISRDALRYYEKEKLISKNSNRNPANNYRDYGEEDVEIIWTIKLLIGIGFTAKEIHTLMNEGDFDFDATISKKVEELERKYEEKRLFLNFAKSIKLTGRIPTTSKLGGVKFNDFMESACKYWNFYDDPKTAPFMKAVELVVSKEGEALNSDETECVMRIVEENSGKEMLHTYAILGYYQVISDMKEFEYSSDMVQRVVRVLHEYLINYYVNSDLEGAFTPQFIAKYTAPFFVNGDIAKLYERIYGKEGCVFIARALAYYGGYDIEDL